MPLAWSVYTLFRFILHPLILVAVRFVPALRKRWEFEQLNQRGHDSFQVSFSQSGHRAQRCYHVSSEGEWEQVWPFVLEDLREGLKTEVLYTSESLEKRVAHSKLGLDSGLIRFWRLPLLSTQSLRRWVSARDFVMCRYDFFPELIFLGLRCQSRGGCFALLSASLKSKSAMIRREGAWPHVFWRWLYSRFDRICLASGREKRHFLQLGLTVSKLWSYEARALQILWRLKNYRHTLEQRGLADFVEVLERESSRSERAIFGSAWERDLGVLIQTLKTTGATPLIVVAPHDLRAPSVKQLQKQIEFHRGVFLCDQTCEKAELEQAVREKKVILLTERGVLLELYPLFARAYVGGGFGRSIHSVLEPYLAQAQVYCGAKTHRSTEVDLIEFERPEKLVVLERQDQALELEKAAVDESIAKLLPPSYYENLYEKELSKLKAARDFLFRPKG